MSCFSLLVSCHNCLLTCSTEVLPRSVFGGHEESVPHSGTIYVRTNGDELQHCSVFRPELHVQGLSQRPKHRSVSITDICLSLFWIGRVITGEHCRRWLSFFSFHPLGRLWQPVCDPDPRWEVAVTSRAEEWHQIPHFYDLYSLCVCIYKYICVFIFNIEHTHINGTPKLCMCQTCPVCYGGNTLVSCGLLYTGEKDVLFIFPYMNLISNKRFKGINIWHIVTDVICLWDVSALM